MRNPLVGQVVFNVYVSTVRGPTPSAIYTNKSKFRQQITARRNYSEYSCGYHGQSRALSDAVAGDFDRSLLSYYQRVRLCHS